MYLVSHRGWTPLIDNTPRGNNSVGKISLQLPKCNGKGVYRAFEAQFNNLATQSCWEDTQAAQMLGFALEGVAQRFYAGLPEQE